VDAGQGRVEHEKRRLRGETGLERGRSVGAREHVEVRALEDHAQEAGLALLRLRDDDETLLRRHVLRLLHPVERLPDAALLGFGQPRAREDVPGVLEHEPRLLSRRAEQIEGLAEPVGAIPVEARLRQEHAAARREGEAREGLPDVVAHLLGQEMAQAPVHQVRRERMEELGQARAERVEVERRILEDREADALEQGDETSVHARLRLLESGDRAPQGVEELRGERPGVLGDLPAERLRAGLPGAVEVEERVPRVTRGGSRRLGGSLAAAIALDATVGDLVEADRAQALEEALVDVPLLHHLAAVFRQEIGHGAKLEELHLAVDGHRLDVLVLEVVAERGHGGVAAEQDLVLEEHRVLAESEGDLVADPEQRPQVLDELAEALLHEAVVGGVELTRPDDPDEAHDEVDHGVRESLGRSRRPRSRAVPRQHTLLPQHGPDDPSVVA
jgi:hypothetical protein